MPIALTYRIILKVLCFLLPLLALAACIDAASISRLRQGAAERLRLFRIRGVQVFLLTVAGFTFLHVASVAYQRSTLWGHVPHSGIPWTTPFFPFYGFHDLFPLAPAINHLRSASFWTVLQAPLRAPDGELIPGPQYWQYPPAAIFPYAVVLWGDAGDFWRGWSGLVKERWMVECAILFLVPTFAFARWLVTRGARPVAAYGLMLGVLLLSYPVWTEVTTGNIEVFVFALISGGLVCYLRGRLVASALLLGVAAGIKIFPFIFFGIFFARKQYREIAYGFLSTVAANLAGLWLISPHLLLSARLVRLGLQYSERSHTLSREGYPTGIDHSIFGSVKQAYFFWRIQPHGLAGFTASSRSLHVYMLSAAVAGIALYFLVIRKLPLLNQIVSLTILAILLPPTSHDYTLIHLYLPWALLLMLAIEAAQTGGTVPGLAPSMICLGMLSTTQMELIVHGDSVNGQFKCFVLLALLGISLKYPWPDERLTDAVSVASDLPDPYTHRRSRGMPGEVAVLPANA